MCEWFDHKSNEGLDACWNGDPGPVKNRSRNRGGGTRQLKSVTEGRIGHKRDKAGATAAFFSALPIREWSGSAAACAFPAAFSESPSSNTPYTGSTED